MKPAFVIPFYGAEIGGGAEMLCRRLAENLVQRGLEVEVLTTCLRDLGSSWNDNYYPPGEYLINGVPVKRFLIRPMNPDIFVAVNNKLVARHPVSLEEEVDYLRNAVNSDALFSYIGDHKRERFYFFLPYLFGTSLNGVSAAPERSFLIPCLHNEGYADMRVTRRMFQKASGALFLSKAEMTLAKTLFDGLAGMETFLLGCGVDELGATDAAWFREKRKLGDAPFILYVGRKDATKNTPLVVDYFARFRRRNPSSPLRLVMAGPGAVPIPEEARPYTLDLGFVTPREKANACAAATLLFQPSLMESFSIVIMESWLAGRPALVHRRCAVTSEHVRESGGGFAIGSFPEFCEALELLLAAPALANAMGARGAEYVRRHYSWDAVCERFMTLYGALEGA